MQDEHAGLVILATVTGHFAAAGEEMQAAGALSELLLGVPPYPLPPRSRDRKMVAMLPTKHAVAQMLNAVT